MTVSIVIPNWNGSAKLQKNLPEVLKISGISEVIIADDASTDDSCDLISQKFPTVKLVKRSRNGGFSSNVNSGVKVAYGELIFLLNNDAVPEAGCLKKILPHFDDPSVFSVGLNAGGSWATGRFANGYFWHGQGNSQQQDLLTTHRTLWVSGGSGVFRKSIWDKLGGLDTLFDPFYEEDVDLGFRATKRGYLNLWEPESKVKHYHEVGVIAAHFPQSAIVKTAERNHLIFIWKNITSNKLIRQHLLALVGKLFAHPRYWLTFLSAAKKLPLILKKRRIEQAESKITDEETFSIFAGN